MRAAAVCTACQLPVLVSCAVHACLLQQGYLRIVLAGMPACSLTLCGRRSQLLGVLRAQVACPSRDGAPSLETPNH